MAHDIDFDLREALFRWAEGDLGATAAVQLLVDTGFLPERLRDAGYTTVLIDGERPVINVRFGEALASESLRFSLSHSEQALLQIAASLAGRAPVDLARALGFLDQRNAELVLSALQIALGQKDPFPVTPKPKPVPARVRVRWQTEWTREYEATIDTDGYNLRTYGDLDTWITDGDNAALIEAEEHADGETVLFTRETVEFHPVAEVTV